MDYNCYLKRLQLALTIFGLWPKPGFCIFYSIYRYLVLGIFCFAYNISEVLSLFFIYSDPRAFGSDMSWSLVHLVGCCKIIGFLTKIKDIQRLCERFEKGLFVGDIEWEKGETKMLESAVKKSIRYLMVYYGFSVVILLNGFIAPFYRDGVNANETGLQPQLPYYTYVICDVDTSPCYEIAYFYQTLSTCVSSLVIIHCDNLYIFLVMLCCSHFKILSRSLETINERAELRVMRSFKTMRRKYGNDGRRGDRKLDDEIDNESLKLGTNCVKHHHAILEVSEELEELYNFLILSQFLSHLIQLCFQMFVVTEVSALSFDGLGMIAFVVSMVIELYLFCECGNEIETESAKVSLAAYNAQWTSASEPVKKTLLLMMLRAQRPVEFTVGKFAKLSLSTLLSVLRGSVSYFMVLREIQQ